MPTVSEKLQQYREGYEIAKETCTRYWMKTDPYTLRAIARVLVFKCNTPKARGMARYALEIARRKRRAAE